MTKALAPIAPPWSDIKEAHSQVLSNFKWKVFSEGEIDLTAEEKQRLVAAVLGDRSPTITNLKVLHAALRDKDQNGISLATSFPELFKIVEGFLREKGITPEPEPQKEDVFKHGLINVDEAVARVDAHFGINSNRKTPTHEILKTALDDLPLTDESVIQLWLAFAVAWKKHFSGEDASDCLSETTRWIIGACCGYANPKGLALPSPSNYSFVDDVAFRS